MSRAGTNFARNICATDEDSERINILLYQIFSQIILKFVFIFPNFQVVQMMLMQKVNYIGHQTQPDI